MKIKRYTTNYFELAKSLLNKCYADYAPVNYLKQETAIIAFDDQDELVGLAIQWRNELHNRTVCIEVCIRPKSRRKGIGNSLYQNLLREFPLRPGDFALDLKCCNEDEKVLGFAESLGFDPYLKCYKNIFNIEDMKIVQSELTLVDLKAFYKDEKNKKMVRDFHCSGYDRDHEPFVPLNKDKKVRHDYYSDGNTEYGVVALNKGEIVGCSFAYLSFEEGIGSSIKDVTALHGYAFAKSAEKEADIVQSLYSYQMQKLKSNGINHVYIEFDSIESISDLMLKWLPYSEKPVIRFQKKL